MALRESLAGSIVGRYRIDSLLAHGGMSEVFVAEDLELRRPVALKVLTPAHAENPGFRERFLKESRLAATIDHPHIVPIYEAGEDDGLLFIAMRLVTGTDLGELIQAEGRLDRERTLRLVRQVAGALDASHRRGLVHRDVKPGNILVAPPAEGGKGEQAYLSDFGLTRHLASTSRHTQTGQLVGSIDYIAPEQIEGEEVDGRADVYSLGCVIFECLAGRPPFRSESDVAVLWGHVQGEIPSLHERRPELPLEIDEVIDGALAKSPDGRYRTAGRLAQALKAALRVRGPLHRMRDVVAPVRAAPVARAASASRGMRVAGAVLALALAAPAVLAVRRAVLEPAEEARQPPGGETVARSPSHERVPPQKPVPARAGGQEDRPENPERSDPGLPADEPLEALGDPVVASRLPRSPETPRQVDEVYQLLSPDGFSHPSRECLPEQRIGCVDFLSDPGERFVTVLITDDAGGAVRAWIRQDRDGDGDIDGEWQEMCDRTEGLVRITPGAVVNILIQSGTCSDGSRSTPTAGTIEVRFYTERP